MSMTEPVEDFVLPERLVTLLTDHLKVALPPERLSPAMTLESLDFDSLALMELVVAAEETYGLSLPDDLLDLSPASTLEEAARLFDAAS
ncbi:MULTISPECIES: acyl carrier protein [Streptomyces]|nr:MULTISPECIES: acyl carrier protein [Streptomyces]